MTSELSKCTCAEVLGENPDCALHGIDTDWAVENYLPSDWQTVATNFRDELRNTRHRTPDMDGLEGWRDIADCPPNEYVLFRFRAGSSKDTESPNVAVGKLYRDGDIWLTAQWASSRADEDPIAWASLSRPTDEAEAVARVVELVQSVTQHVERHEGQTRFVLADWQMKILDAIVAVGVPAHLSGNAAQADTGNA